MARLESKNLLLYSLLAFIIAAEQSSVETPNNKEGLKMCVQLEDDCCFVSGKGVIVAEREWKMMLPTRSKSSSTGF
jgi:hypothetical protein